MRRSSTWQDGAGYSCNRTVVFMASCLRVLVIPAPSRRDIRAMKMAPHPGSKTQSQGYAQYSSRRTASLLIDFLPPVWKTGYFIRRLFHRLTHLARGGAAMEGPISLKALSDGRVPCLWCTNVGVCEVRPCLSGSPFRCACHSSLPSVQWQPPLQHAPLYKTKPSSCKVMQR